MSNVLIDDGTMTDIADAIREKTETEDTYLPSEMPAAVRSIQGGAKPIELTKAEYDALPDYKLTDNKMYLLTDYAERGGGGGASTNYSTEEQVIGTWIDGKPLYQKTIDIGHLPNAGSNEYALPSNTEYVIDATGFAYSTTYGYPYTRFMPFCDANSLTNNISVDVSNSKIRIVTSGDWSSYTGYLTLKYTKATD